MNKKLSSAAGLFVLATAGAFLAPAAQAGTAATAVPYLCPTEVDGEPFVLDYERGYDVTAPAQVQPGEHFTVKFDSEPINPLPQFNKQVWDVRMVFTLPADAEVAGYELVGGSNLGDSQQNVQVEGDRLILDATGPFVADEDADLPDLVVELVAPAEGELVTAPAGTSYDDPGFRWTSEDPSNGQVGDLQCYPDPKKPVRFTTTAVQATEQG
ncbi:hypothetical protein [Saccharopolyspora gloriosae]|uniref:hypothetical protein n=1 Tax=Saccharopolyspora gloriosae TaxID=455344 RepID=UPI001FB5A802|nr:hypothetical protein [Saccharopolyspora gloriosae]